MRRKCGEDHLGVVGGREGPAGDSGVDAIKGDGRARREDTIGVIRPDKPDGLKRGTRLTADQARGEGKLTRTARGVTTRLKTCQSRVSTGGGRCDKGRERDQDLRCWGLPVETVEGK